MSLLKRIERARPAGEGETQVAAVAPTPAAPAPAGAGQTPAVPPTATPPSTISRPFLGSLPARESFREAKYRVQNRMINELDPKLDLSNQVEVRRQIEELFGKIADEEGLALTRAERVRMLEQITDEILGLGPLEPLLRDDTITELMVNGPQQVYIEREGRLELTNVTFQNDEHVMKIIQRIIAPIGRRVDESSPMVDARLADGSRVNAIIPPLSLIGPVITIRKFAATPFTVEDLIRFGTATPEMFEFLEACVKARLNIFVSPAAPAPARRRCSTSSRPSSPTTSGSSRSRTRPSSSFDRSTWSPWRLAPRTSRARAQCRSASSCGTPCACGPTASSSASAGRLRRSTCSRP